MEMERLTLIGTRGEKLQTDSSNLKWFALRVKSNYEHKVSGALQAKGFEEFLPTCRALRRWSDRLKEIRTPLFTGYVFCRLDMQNRLPVLTVPGVVGIVGVGKMPMPVTPAEILAIRAIAESDLLLTQWPYLQVGNRVEIVRGPLTGVEGILVRFKGRYRLVVSVTLLQRSVAVEIDGDWARALQPIRQSA